MGGQCLFTRTHVSCTVQKRMLLEGWNVSLTDDALLLFSRGSGISLLLIERSKGVKTTQMKCSGVWSSGTTYVEFDDVLVPVGNLIGKENQGFKSACTHAHIRTAVRCYTSSSLLEPPRSAHQIISFFLFCAALCFLIEQIRHGMRAIEYTALRKTKCVWVWFRVADSVRCLAVCSVAVPQYNFNHERWSTAIGAIRFARVCVEEAMKHAFKRKTFGKKLIEHPGQRAHTPRPHDHRSGGKPCCAAMQCSGDRIRSLYCLVCTLVCCAAVIRFKLANMARQVESAHAWLESLTYQMKTLPHSEQASKLGGPIGHNNKQQQTTSSHNAAVCLPPGKQSVIDALAIMMSMVGGGLGGSPSRVSALLHFCLCLFHFSSFA